MVTRLLSARSPHSFYQVGLWRSKARFPERMLQFLQTESARLCGEIEVPRPWHYGELHNPWGRAAAAYDSWGLLDLCQSSALLETIAALIGTDIILFDSQWLPDCLEPREAESTLESDAHRFPLDPRHGLTALVCFADQQTYPVGVDYKPLHPRSDDAQDWVSVEFQRGEVLYVDCQVPYRVRSTPGNRHPVVYAIRYFSAHSRYERDPTSAVHRVLMERYPLINYAQMPLWLVHGQDRAGNDFVTGFNVRAGFWTGAGW